jgi:hypothetical protein
MRRWKYYVPGGTSCHQQTEGFCHTLVSFYKITRRHITEDCDSCITELLNNTHTSLGLIPIPDQKPINLGFHVHTVALGLTFLQAFRFSPCR